MITKAFTKQYDDFKLSMPSLLLEPKKIYAVIGANGCGKSTMAKVLSGVIPSDEGFIKAVGIGYLPQKSYAFRSSVKRNVRLNASSKEIADALMERLALNEISSRNAKTLSGGQHARMALARLLAAKYDLVILDEPTAAMDVKNSLAAESIMKEYAKTGSSILLITHSLQQAKRIADEVIYIEDGKIVESGETEQVLNDPADKRTKAFIDFYGI